MESRAGRGHVLRRLGPDAPPRQRSQRPGHLLRSVSTGYAGPRRTPGSVRQCRCFSLCDERGALDFLQHVPSVVESRDSPWYGYLQVVYGPRLPLPLNLSGFNFFYHHHSRWPTNVEWPMPTCLKNGTLDGAWPFCGATMCARWRHTTSSPPLGRAIRLKVAVYRDGVSSRGSSIVEVEHAKFAQSAGAKDEAARIRRSNALLGHELLPSDSYIEVFRRMRSREGMQGYGCWFFPTRGSGIWLSTGRTMQVHYKQNLRALTRMWSSNASIDHAASAKARKALPAGESFTIMAYELGFHSVQLQFNFNRFFAEMVYVNDGCMHRTAALGACVPGLAAYKGWLHAHERLAHPSRRSGVLSTCTCDNSLQVLNCDL